MTVRAINAALALTGFFSGSICAAAGMSEDATVRELRAQLQALRGELTRVEARLDALQAEPADPSAALPAEPAGPPAALAGGSPSRGETAAADDRAAPSWDMLDQRVSRLENVAQSWTSAIRIGGAARLNYSWLDYDQVSRDRVGDAEVELFRINAQGDVGDLSLNAEWRQANDFQAIGYAFFDYDFAETLTARLGISRVPFGILPFASHSFWASGAYYLGFEDDFDTGLQLIHSPNDDWTFHYAFFKNPEYANDSRTERFTFDLIAGGEQQNVEQDQWNFRAARELALGEDASLEWGVSLETGRLYNRETRDSGDRYAFAGHLSADVGLWNAQLEGIRFAFDPENPAGISDDFVQFGAYGFPFLAAAEGDVFIANLARRFELSLGPVTGGACYNDFTWIEPRVGRSASSAQNVTGCSLLAGGLYTYIDWIVGRNMWFSGGDGIGLDGPDADQWKTRLNINVGFYF